MAAAARSSSAAPSRSEQRTRSTSHRFGATCASDVTLGGVGGAAAGGGATGAGGGADCCCAADGCAYARQHVNRTATSSFFIIVHLFDEFELSPSRFWSSATNHLL